MLNVDRPIEFEEQDRLDFLPSARALGRSLAKQPFGEGLVIAPNGEGGSGKTSVTNLAIRSMWQLETDEQLKFESKHTIVYRFEPWLNTGHQNLIVEFSSGLAEALEKPFVYEVSQAMRRLAGGIYRRSNALLGAATIGVDAIGGGGAACGAE